MEPYEQPPPFLQIDHINSTYLHEVAKWGKFPSIVGFVMCGIMVLLAFFIGSIMSSLSPFNQLRELQGEEITGPTSLYGGAFTVLYLVIAAIYILPCLYLYKFSDKMKSALLASDQVDLTASFSNLKSLFKFMGIITLILLCVYGFGILIMLVSFAAIF